MTEASQIDLWTRIVCAAFEEAGEGLRPMAGTPRGFEVTGSRATPRPPTMPTVTEILEGRTRRVA
jgi:hypothetical protein